MAKCHSVANLNVTSRKPLQNLDQILRSRKPPCSQTAVKEWSSLSIECHSIYAWCKSGQAYQSSAKQQITGRRELTKPHGKQILDRSLYAQNVRIAITLDMKSSITGIGVWQDSRVTEPAQRRCLYAHKVCCALYLCCALDLKP